MATVRYALFIRRLPTTYDNLLEPTNLYIGMNIRAVFYSSGRNGGARTSKKPG
jgi:hypothetical protein